jgi:hypothetical protein
MMIKSELQTSEGFKPGKRNAGLDKFAQLGPRLETTLPTMQTQLGMASVGDKDFPTPSTVAKLPLKPKKAKDRMYGTATALINQRLNEIETGSLNLEPP